MDNQIQSSSDQSEVKTENKEKIYYSRAKQYRISNFVKEKWEGNRLVQREGPVRFYENSHITSDKAEIKHIEESSGFLNGDIILCETMKQLAELRAGNQVIRKNMRNFSDESIERVRVE